MKQLKSLFIVFALLVGTAAMCVKEIPVDRVLLDEFEIEMTEGDTRQLTYKIRPADATNQEVTWTSVNPQVASVSNSGVVTALKAGSADITVTTLDGFKTAKCLVKVVSKNIPVKSVALDKTSCVLYENEELSLEATVLPEDATDKSLKWTTDNSKVADVTSSGRVIAVSAGDAVITVTTVDGNFNDKCRVTVKTRGEEVVPVTSVTLDKTTLPLKVGETYTLTAKVLPEDATDKTVNWESSKPGVATVSSEGFVKAIAEGTTVVTASCGDKKAQCTVTVEKKTVPVASVTLDKTALPLKVGDTYTLTATVKPDDATDKTVTWSSSKPGVATVTNGLVKAIAEGTAVVTARCGDKEAQCTVTVEKKTVPVTSVTLDKTTLPLKVGETYTLTAKVLPEDATDKTVNWESSNESVATVQKGIVTAKTVGQATITATCGDKDAQCEVTVTAAPSNSYNQWLGTWTVKNGTRPDVWTVVEKIKGSTYTIKGLGGKTYDVEATFDPSNSTMVVYAQNNLGKATSSTYGDGVVGLYGEFNDGSFASPGDWNNPYPIFACFYADDKATLVPYEVTIDATSYAIENAYLIAEAADGSYFSVGSTALPTTMVKGGQGGGDDKPAYREFLGVWEIPHGDGATTDTWTISQKVAGSTYTITGIEGYSDLAIEAEYDSSNGSIVVRAQEEVGVRTISGAECPVGFYGATANGTFWLPGEQAYAIFTGSVSGDKITIEPNAVSTQSGDVIPELALYIASVNGSYSLLKKFADATKLPNTLTRKGGQGGGDDPAGDITGKWICPKASDYWGDTYSDWAINIKASGKNYVIEDFDLGFDSFLAQHSLKAQPAPATLSGKTLVVADNTPTGITGGGNPIVWRGVDSEDYYSDILFTVDLANNTISLASALFGAFDTDPSDPGWYSLYAAPVVFYKEGHVPSSVKACGTVGTATRHNFKSMTKSFKVLSGEQFQPRMKPRQAKSLVLKKRTTRY